MAELITVSD